ncbi:MAG: 3-phosphoshikimate 1-carboxyvinyltransferase [Actinomycetota bacterium]|nr:3-phosphoshikimate 1-carboxyvinyltransferase [Actinomycetota bacterium]
MNARFAPGGPLRGRLRVPADKSISHRAAIVAAMARSPVRIANYLNAADTGSTLAAMRSLGARVEALDGELEVSGPGLRGARGPAAPIDVGNAGTLMRLLPGWLSFQAGATFVLDGDESIRRRPVDRIVAPLTLMGASLEARDGRFPPLRVDGGELTGIAYELPVASAQVKSCLLLAGLATGGTEVIEPVPTRDHTERMLLAAGASLRRSPGKRGYRTTVAGGSAPELERIEVPGDLSSAAFLLAAAVLVPGSELVLEGVGVNWTRAGFLRILKRMGARVRGELESEGGFGPAEPVSDLEVRGSALSGTAVAAEEVPLAIDELPLVALLGCFAEGETVVHGAGELRVKESDRIATVVAGLRGLGADIEPLPDGFGVRGTGGLRGGELDAQGDHRLALLGAVAGLASREGVEIHGFEAVEVSYPRFAEDVGGLLA